MPQSNIRRATDWGIYLGVAASVISGLLIAYLRPGAAIIPEGGREFTTSRVALNFWLEAHSFISIGLEWLCGFHVAYSLSYWIIKKSRALALEETVFLRAGTREPFSGRLQESETFGPGSSYRFTGRSARLIAALMLSRLGNQKLRTKRRMV